MDIMTDTNALMEPIDLDTWPRQQHFELFKNFEHYWNYCETIEIVWNEKYYYVVWSFTKIVLWSYLL